LERWGDNVRLNDIPAYGFFLKNPFSRTNPFLNQIFENQFFRKTKKIPTSQNRLVSRLKSRFNCTCLHPLRQAIFVSGFAQNFF
jgi:hypothetical protein